METLDGAIRVYLLPVFMIAISHDLFEDPSHTFDIYAQQGEGAASTALNAGFMVLSAQLHPLKPSPMDLLNSTSLEIGYKMHLCMLFF